MSEAEFRARTNADTDTPTAPPAVHDSPVKESGTEAAVDAAVDTSLDPAWATRRVWCVRHGQAEHNRSGNNHIRDPVLTALGKQQAVAGRAVVADAAAEVVIVSPLKRALETAMIMFGDALRAGTPLELEPRVQEAWPVPADTGVPPAELQRFLDDHYAEFGVSTAGLADNWFAKSGANAGTEDAVHARVRGFVQTLATRSEDRIAVVCHAAVLKRMTGIEFANGEARAFRLARDDTEGGAFTLVPADE